MLTNFSAKFISLFFICCFFLVDAVFAQYEGFIYGEVILKNKKVYTGPIKWSGDQRLWSDVLVLNKSNKEVLQYLDAHQREALDGEKSSGLDWKFMNLWRDTYPKRKNEVFCRFGDIHSIHVTGSDKAQFFFKNGDKVRVRINEDDSRHLGKNIVVYYKGDSKTLHWEEISWINFKDMPQGIRAARGEPLYGTITTTNGVFTGFIQWDKYKYLNAHQLQGKINGIGSVLRYTFHHIQKIERKDNRALLFLHSGKKVLLGGTRDVSNSNRGIVVMHPSFGRVVVEWKAFRAITFKQLPKTGLSYSDYPKPTRIYANLLTKNNEKLKGECTFDLDEEWDVEMLDGRKDGLHYQIPFRLVKQVIPFRDYYTKVLLKNGRTLLLGWENDVSHKNWGAIIWTGNPKFRYVQWNNIKKITFR